MAISGVNPKCFILALFVRDDGARFLLGDDPFEFKDNQLHFQQNTMANDVVEVQGNDGYLLAGQVRRPGTQVFDGYVCNGTNSKEEVEVKRRAFLQFFRRSHFYKVIYVFPNGTAIQRKQGFLVDDPTVQELYQQYPEYHVALNFEDVNYYTYEEDDQGHEIYAKEAIVPLARGGATGGLIWDEYGIVWEDPWSLPLSISGKQFQILNNAGAVAPIENTQLQGDIYQQTYTGRNLYQSIGATNNGITGTLKADGTLQISGTATSSSSNFTARMSISLPAGTYTFSLTKAAPFRMLMRSNLGQNHWVIEAGQTSATQTVSSGITELWVWGYNLTSGTSYNFDIGFQLEAGSSASLFEPYVGGIPAPNPDYPQVVQTVAGEQTVTVTGKNLLDKDRVNQYMGYFDGNADNPTLISGASGRNRVIYVKCKPNTTYSISLLDRTGINNPQVGTTDSLPATGVAVAKLGTFPGSSLKFENLTTSATAQYLCIRFQTNSPSVEFDNIAHTLLSGLQIEYGPTATEYEPYHGQSYLIDLRGKNLLNISDFEMGGLTNGNPTTSDYRIENANHPIAVQPNTTYTLSAQLVSPVQGFRVGVHECQADGTFIRDLGWKQIGTDPVALTTGSDTYYLKMVGSLSTTSTNVSTGGTENTTACSTVTEFMRGCTLMFEKGSTATNYEPYNAIELCKIGDYQDYIYKSGDDWYVRKKVRHLSLAIAGMDNSNNFPGWKNVSELAQDFPAGTNVNMNTLTDSWDNITGVNLKDSGRLIWGANNNSSGLLFASRGFFGSTWTQTYWITNYPNLVVELYYGITTTPTDTKITDATLVGQLEALGATKLFIGENNVLVGATGTNLPATLAFDYYTKFAAIGAEWEEGGTKGATIVDVDAIDNTYPVWELTGPATNPTLSVLTTNTALTYNGTITASQKLVIDMFNKTATLNGTSVIGNISGDFVYMAPGTNRVTYTAGNTDAPDSTIYWQEVVG